MKKLKYVQKIKKLRLKLISIPLQRNIEELLLGIISPPNFSFVMRFRSGNENGFFSNYLLSKEMLRPKWFRTLLYHEAEFSIIISLTCIKVELSNTTSPPPPSTRKNINCNKAEQIIYTVLTSWGAFHSFLFFFY